MISLNKYLYEQKGTILTQQQTLDFPPLTDALIHTLRNACLWRTADASEQNRKSAT
jgi:hypothetical protein